MYRSPRLSYKCSISFFPPPFFQHRWRYNEFVVEQIKEKVGGASIDSIMRNARRKFDNYALCKFALEIRVRPRYVRFRSANLRHSFFLSFFLSFSFFFYIAFALEGYCFHLISTNIFPDVDINFFYIPSLPSILLSTSPSEFRFPFFYSHSPATSSKATKMPGCSFAWKNGRISKGVPLISISKPYLTPLGFCSCPLFSLPRRPFSWR